MVFVSCVMNFFLPSYLSLSTLPRYFAPRAILLLDLHEPNSISIRLSFFQYLPKKLEKPKAHPKFPLA